MQRAFVFKRLFFVRPEARLSVTATVLPVARTDNASQSVAHALIAVRPGAWSRCRPLPALRVLLIIARVSVGVGQTEVVPSDAH